jgi:hypothetical protein
LAVDVTVEPHKVTSVRQRIEILISESLSRMLNHVPLFARFDKLGGPMTLVPLLATTTAPSISRSARRSGVTMSDVGARQLALQGGGAGNAEDDADADCEETVAEADEPEGPDAEPEAEAAEAKMEDGRTPPENLTDTARVLELAREPGALTERDVEACVDDMADALEEIAGALEGRDDREVTWLDAEDCSSVHDHVKRINNEVSLREVNDAQTQTSRTMERERRQASWTGCDVVRRCYRSSNNTHSYNRFGWGGTCCRLDGYRCLRLLNRYGLL